MPRQTRILDVSSADADAIFARSEPNLDAVEQFGVPLQKHEAVASTSRQASGGVKRSYPRCEVVDATLVNVAFVLQMPNKAKYRCR